MFTWYTRDMYVIHRRILLICTWHIRVYYWYTSIYIGQPYHTLRNHRPRNLGPDCIYFFIFYFLFFIFPSPPPGFFLSPPRGVPSFSRHSAHTETSAPTPHTPHQLRTHRNNCLGPDYMLPFFCRFIYFFFCRFIFFIIWSFPLENEARAQIACRLFFSFSFSLFFQFFISFFFFSLILFNPLIAEMHFFFWENAEMHCSVFSNEISLLVFLFRAGKWTMW